ncbi:SsrA-binding protein [uncultured Alphaproteobacteria bacterium]|uniref:SsrA-binding protein n=1 Tax=uncultured Alphaproteobacteria bacterium TaxID=91750 RepID=A0A212J768_9PROT|nr:SsrA-binding protein [uncultured Alphaproteobacteria bacterium]
MKQPRKALISTGMVSENRRARYDYQIESTLEAGLVLSGSEVKSLRHGQANLNDSFAGALKEGGEAEVGLYNAYIPEYAKATIFQHEARRVRKLLLHKREARKWLASVAREGRTIVPLKLYFNDKGVAKVLLGLATGKKQHDKRETEKARDWQRDKARIMRERG